MTEATGLQPAPRAYSRCAGGLIAAALAFGGPAVCLADFQQNNFRAQDGTAYQVLRFEQDAGTDAERFRVTSVFGSATGGAACSSSNNAPGTAVSAVAGALVPLQSLHPFTSVLRTAVLLPNDLSAIAFSSTNGGTLTLGNGGGAIKVCRVPSDCSGGVPVVSLATASVDVAAACVANGVNAQCDGANTRQLLAFGLPATGNVCNAPGNTTLNTTICAAKPTDGFDLPGTAGGSAIVFVYNGSLAGKAFTVGAAGFGIDTDNNNVPGCSGSGAAGDPSPDPGDQVVDSAARVDTQNAPRLPPPPPPPKITSPALSPKTLLALAAALSLAGLRILERRQRFAD